MLSALPECLDSSAPAAHPGLAVSRTDEEIWRVAVPRALSKWKLPSGCSAFELPEAEPKSYIVRQIPAIPSILARVGIGKERFVNIWKFIVVRLERKRLLVCILYRGDWLTEASVACSMV